jgi:hypothetical protein
MAVLRRELIPAPSLCRILVRSLAITVHPGERVLGIGQTLRGRLAEPLDGLGVVSRHPVAGERENAEIVLGNRVALHAGLAPVGGRLAIVLLDPAALGIHQSEIGLRRRHAELGCGLVPLDGQGQIPGHTASRLVEQGKAVLRLAIALLGERLPLAEGGLVVALLERLETCVVIRQGRGRPQQRQRRYCHSCASETPKPSCRCANHTHAPCHRRTMQRRDIISNCSY